MALQPGIGAKIVTRVIAYEVTRSMASLRSATTVAWTAGHMVSQELAA